MYQRSSYDVGARYDSKDVREERESYDMQQLSRESRENKHDSPRGMKYMQDGRDYYLRPEERTNSPDPYQRNGSREDYSHAKNYPVHPNHNSRADPHYYGREVYNYPYVPRVPRDYLYHRYEADMRRSPFMYDPADLYPPRYYYNPNDYFAAPSRPPVRFYERDYYKKRKRTDREQEVDFEEEVQEMNYDALLEVQASKRKVRLVLLLFVFLFVVAAIVMGALATAMDSWWVKETTSGGVTYETIRIGLWRACSRSNPTENFDCRNYSSSGSASPYSNMTLLRWSMVAAVIAAFIAIIFNILALFGRHSKLFKVLIYTLIFLVIAATVLFGLVIAYVNQDKNASLLVPLWIPQLNSNLKTSKMFYITCAVTASSIMALILSATLVFTDEQEINEEEAQALKAEKKESAGRKPSLAKDNKNGVIGTKKNISKNRNKDNERLINGHANKSYPVEQMNGHVNKAYQGELAVITRDTEGVYKSQSNRKRDKSTPVSRPRQLNQIPENEYLRTQQKEPLFYKKDQDYLQYESDRRSDKYNRNRLSKTSSQPKQPIPTPPPPPPMPSQPSLETFAKPVIIKEVISKSRSQDKQERRVKKRDKRSIKQLYDGDYDNYFNEAY